MAAYHVVHSLLSFVLVQIVSSTDILVTYEHNVLLLRSANLDNYSVPVPLVTPALHFPHGLAFKPPSRDAGGGGLAFVSDTQSGEASVFALQLSEDHIVQHKEPVIKRSPQMLSHAVYSASENALFVSSLLPVPGVARSSLSEDFAKHWSPEPSLVASAQIGTVRGVTLDQCSGNLYWSETSNSSSSVSMLPTLLSSSEARALPLSSATPSFYQGLHYDDTSKTLIIAVTDSDNYTISSCRFISYRETREANERSFDSKSTSNELDGKISIIAENISNCYPVALSTDHDYIYYSDWSRNAVMRLSKTDPSDLVQLFATTPSKLLGQSRFGAYDVLALNENESQWENSCILSKSTSLGPSTRATDGVSTTVSEVGNTEFSSEGLLLKTVPVNDNQRDTVFKLLPSNKSKDRFNAVKVSKPFTPSSLTTGTVVLKKDEESLQPYQTWMSTGSTLAQDGLKRHKETRSRTPSADNSRPSVLVTSQPSLALEYPDEFLRQNAYEVEHRHAPNPADDGSQTHVAPSNSPVWFPMLSREELVLTIFVLLILCGGLCLVSTVLSIRQFKYCHKSGSSSRAGALSNNRRAYGEVNSCPARSARNECAIDIERTNEESINGTTDLIIDLSSQDDIQVNSEIPTSTGRRKKKKTFGPKNGSIKHLISKSFSKDGQKGSSTRCPGLQSSDGVTLNIEDCCQMTLCETPCYTSVRKEGKGYRSSGAAADDDQTTLLDDEQHTLC